MWNGKKFSWNIHESKPFFLLFHIRILRPSCRFSQSNRLWFSESWASFPIGNTQLLESHPKHNSDDIQKDSCQNTLFSSQIKPHALVRKRVYEATTQIRMHRTFSLGESGICTWRVENESHSAKLWAPPRRQWKRARQAQRGDEAGRRVPSLEEGHSAIMTLIYHWQALGKLN